MGCREIFRKSQILVAFDMWLPLLTIHASTPLNVRHSSGIACRAGAVRSTSPVCTTSVARAATTPPDNKDQMLRQACAAIKTARAVGINRYTLRLFLPRNGELAPADESWEGGIMQLFAVTSPLARDLLRLVSSDIAGVPPALSESRLDKSGVD